MRRITSLITATLVVLISSLWGLSAQETPPTPKTHPTIPTIQAGAKWMVYKVTFGIYCQTSEKPEHWNYWYSSTEQYALTKLETIDGKTYFVLGDKTDYGYSYTYLREDLTSGKIYARYKSGVNGGAKSEVPEYVLWDYNIKVGDQVTLHDIDGSTARHDFTKSRYTLVVSAIETRHLYDADRLVYVMKDMTGIPLPANEIYWIEGIGYSFGFLFTGIRTEESIGGYGYETRIPLCYTAPNGDVYHFHHSGICEAVNGFTGNKTIEASRTTPLDLQISRNQLGLTIRVADGKHHDLTIYRADGTKLVEATSFVESYNLALPMASGEKILVVVDDETIPYVL